MIKYVDYLKNVIVKEFCEGVGFKVSFGIEFSKMRNFIEWFKVVGFDILKLWLIRLLVFMFS